MFKSIIVVYIIQKSKDLHYSMFSRIMQVFFSIIREK